ncbi:hypothetical protein SAMN05421693_1472, partial [Ectothiorhodospira magna]
GATAYTLTDAELNLDDLSEDELAIVTGATNAGDYVDLDDSTDEPGELGVPSFALVGKPSEFVVAEDAVATIYAVQATAAQYTNADKLVFQFAGDNTEEVTIDVSKSEGLASLRTILEANKEFKAAGLKAASAAATGTLTITDAQGRAFKTMELIEVPQFSNAQVNLLQSRLVNTDIVYLNIDGEQIELRGFDVADEKTGTAIAISIQTKLRAIENADGEKPYADMTVDFDADTSILTIADPARREISELSLQRTTDSKVEIKLGENDLAHVKQLELTFMGQTKVVGFVADKDDLANNINAAFGVTGIKADIATNENTVTISDTWGRDFGAGRLLSGGEGATASETIINDISAAEVGQFSITIGTDANAKIIEKVDVSGSTTLAELVDKINDALGNSGLEHVEASVQGTNSIKLTNAAGTGISGVYAGTELDAGDVSRVEISGLTDVLAGKVAEFSIKVGGKIFILKNTADENLAKGEINFSAIKTIDDLAGKLEKALQAMEAINERDDITVTVRDADNDPDTTSQTIIITDTAGRALSEIKMTGAEGKGKPASATIKGMNDSVAKLDLGYIEIKYGAEKVAKIEKKESSIFIKNKSDTLVDGNGENKPGFVGKNDWTDFEDQQTVTLNISQITSNVALKILGVTLGNDSDGADTLKLGGVAAEDGTPDFLDLAKLLSSIQVAKNQTAYHDLFTKKEFLSVKLNFKDGGSIELIDLIALDVKTAENKTVKDAVNGALDEGEGITATYQSITNEEAIVKLIEIMGENLELQKEDHENPNSVNAPINLGQTFLALEFGNQRLYVQEDDENLNLIDDVEVVKDAIAHKLGENFKIEFFAEDENLIITALDGTEITSVAFKTGPNGVSVIDDVELTKAVEGKEGIALDIGVIGTVSNASTGAPVFGVQVVVTEAGTPAGLNAEQLGDAGVVIASEQTPVIIISTTYSEGAPGAPVAGGLQLIQEGADAVDDAAWIATFNVALESELKEAYTFSLTLTEVLAEDAAEGTEAAIFEFTLEAEVGQTAEDIRDAMVAKIDADAAFIATLNEDSQIIVTAVAKTTNYDVETDVVLVGVSDDMANGG